METKLKKLTEMGFSKADAIEALRECGFNEEVASSILMQRKFGNKWSDIYHCYWDKSMPFQPDDNGIAKIKTDSLVIDLESIYPTKVKVSWWKSNSKINF